MQATAGTLTVQYDVGRSGREALILLPALGANASMWGPQREVLERDYLLITCETGGHSPYSPAEHPRTLADFADGVIAVMDAVGVNRGHILGLSMGGMIAQELAIRYSDRVRSLIVAAATGRYPDDRRTAMRQRADTAEREGMDSVAETTPERWLTAPFRTSRPDIAEWVKGMVRAADPRSYAEGARAVADVDTLSRLSAVEQPALVIGAANDESMPPGAAEALAKALPTAGTTVLPDAAHLCNVEAAERFNVAIGDFLENLSATDDGATEPMGVW